MVDHQRPLKVFLSYASQDRPAVRALERRLSKESWIDVWFDNDSLLPGEDWRIKIEEAVECSDVIIICLSNTSISKEGYGQKEQRYAREIALEKPEGMIFLIPLRLDDCEVPRGFRFLQWVDYFGENKEDAYHALLDALRVRREQILTKPKYKAGLRGRNRSFVGAENLSRAKSVRSKPIIQKDRLLEAAIQKQVAVHKPASLYVWIKRVGSKSIISVVQSNVDKNAVLDESSTQAKTLELEFPVEDGEIGKASVSLRLVAPEFSPHTQQKEIKVPPDGDSDVCTFIVTPQKAGELLLNIEVLKGEYSLTNQSLHTTAIETEPSKVSPVVVVTIPMVVVVHNAALSQEIDYQRKTAEEAEERAWIEAKQRAERKARQEADEIAEKRAREKAESKSALKQKTESHKKDSPASTPWPKNTPYKNAPNFQKLLLFLIPGFVFLLVLIGYPIISPILHTSSTYTLTPTSTSTITKTPVPTATKTIRPTSTPTKTRVPAIIVEPTLSSFEQIIGTNNCNDTIFVFKSAGYLTVDTMSEIYFPSNSTFNLTGRVSEGSVLLQDTVIGGVFLEVEGPYSTSRYSPNVWAFLRYNNLRCIKYVQGKNPLVLNNASWKFEVAPK